MKPFQIFESITGCLTALCDEQFPTSFYAWSGEPLELPADGTHFGFVQRGEATLICNAGEFGVREKMFFCVPDSLRLEGGEGIVVTRLGYRGLFCLGGAIEETGRLRYIDGCTDTLLIPPILKGDPCLNALYFPPHIRQTPHTHPSVRIGIISKGRGECVVPGAGTFPLLEGQAFVIAPGALHSFNTESEEMVVIAYHPDSDFGATHENHPMVNMTFVDSVSAKYLDEIKTK